jgi:hypothetical protein
VAITVLSDFGKIRENMVIGIYWYHADMRREKNILA